MMIQYEIMYYICFSYFWIKKYRKNHWWLSGLQTKIITVWKLPFPFFIMFGLFFCCCRCLVQMTKWSSLILVVYWRKNRFSHKHLSCSVNHLKGKTFEVTKKVKNRVKKNIWLARLNEVVMRDNLLPLLLLLTNNSEYNLHLLNSLKRCLVYIAEFHRKWWSKYTIIFENINKQPETK